MKRNGTCLWRMVVGVMFISSSAFAQGPLSKMAGGSPAIVVFRPDGTKTDASIEGNKLRVRDATGKLWISAGPIDNKSKTGIDGPDWNPLAASMKQSPDKPLQPSAPGGMGSPVATQGGASGPLDTKAIRIEQLSKAQFKALSDDTLLEIGGRKIRKADFVAEFKRRATAGPAGAAIRPSGLAAIQARLRGEADAAIAASAEEVRRRLAEIRAQGGDR